MLFNTFPKSSRFGHLLCDYLPLFRNKVNQTFIDKVLKPGLESGVEWQYLDTNCISTLFTSSLANNRIYKTTGDKLRLRYKADLSAATVIQLSKGIEVFVRQIGDSQTIAGRRGNWFNVITENSEQGWLFGAYLKPIR